MLIIHANDTEAGTMTFNTVDPTARIGTEIRSDQDTLT